MPAARTIAVIDIGKSNAKVLIASPEGGGELDRLSTPNAVRTDGPYPHYDTQALWQFILTSLRQLGARHRVDAISITTHGASAALLGADGGLALPVLDYEHAGPDSLREAYEAARPAFAETGAPALPAGLNLGAQLFWQSRAFPDAFASVRHVVTYPQYWAYRLSGVLANEVSSLGCHTDLWAYHRRDFSTLVDIAGWRPLMAPVRPASDVLGPLLPEVARQTGLNATTPVLCGIHDSNASLLPHLLSQQAPFSVVSTGTWVIAMAVGAQLKPLDPARDTLVNVNVFGDPVPSARFMGGREFEMLGPLFAGSPLGADPAAGAAAVLSQGALLLPSVKDGCGPYPNRQAQWLNDSGLTPPQRKAAASFYLALMTATCLDLIGADGPTLVEGPFAANPLFMAMLASATGRPVVGSTASAGTALGAALLGLHAAPPAAPASPASPNPAMAAYAAAWRAAVSRAQPSEA